MGAGPAARGAADPDDVTVELGGLPASREPSQNRPPHRQLQLDASQGPQQSHHLVEAQFAPIAPASPTPWTEDGIPTASCSDAGEGSKGKTDCAAVTRSSSGGAGPAECRVCLLADGEPGAGELVSPCHCAGSLRYVHMNCLVRWATEKASLRCELCNTPYNPEIYGVLAAVLEEAGVQHDHGQPRPPGARRGLGIPGLPGVVSPGPSEPQQDSPEQRRAAFWRTVMFNLAVLVVLVGAVLYLTLFSNFSSGSGWMVILWRVLIVIIPAWLIGRLVILVVCKWREDRRQQAHEAEASALATPAIPQQQGASPSAV